MAAARRVASAPASNDVLVEPLPPVLHAFAMAVAAIVVNDVERHPHLLGSSTKTPAKDVEPK
jgi:hypothetical protein